MEQQKERIIPPKEILQLMPVDIVRELRAYVFDSAENKITIAAQYPQDDTLHSHLKNIFAGQEIAVFQATENDIQYVIDNYTRNYKEEINKLAAASDDNNGSASLLADLIMKFAVAEKASDIHIEPDREKTAIKYRIDGVLHTIAEIPRSCHQTLIARFKILAELKIDEHRRPQDGRIEPHFTKNISLRVSTVPTLFGEKIAMRILEESGDDISLESLGFTKVQREILKRNIEKPFGMIVASGPTGSGKTTTLYSLLHQMPKDGINISTLEDPIESYLPNINQIQVNPRVELTFASGLRTLLRQDPDVIMVGEIRDSETVVMAANSAMTGHLVLTTMHTNDAPSAFVRFLEMKVEDFVVASMVNLVIAQRLVRRICAECAYEDMVSDAQAHRLKKRPDIITALKNSRAIKNINDVDTISIRTGKGCEKCLYTGYSGRIGLYEMLEMNKNLHDLILEHAPAEKIRETAEKNGFRTIIDDGVEKVLAGHTSFDELLRTTKRN